MYYCLPLSNSLYCYRDTDRQILTHIHINISILSQLDLSKHWESSSAYYNYIKLLFDHLCISKVHKLVSKGSEECTSLIFEHHLCPKYFYPHCHLNTHTHAHTQMHTDTCTHTHTHAHTHTEYVIQASSEVQYL